MFTDFVLKCDCSEFPDNFFWSLADFKSDLSRTNLKLPTQITSDMGIPTVTDTQNIDPVSDDKTGADPNTLLMCLLL